MNFFTVDILTPEKIVVEGVPAEALLIPTVRGQINVLPNHTHIINKLTTGVLTIFGGADDPDVNYFVSGGICKVLNDRVIIMGHMAQAQHEIDAEDARRSLDHALAALQGDELLSDDEIKKYRSKVQIAEIQLQMTEERA